MHLESCNLSSLTMLMENHGRSTRNPPEVNIAFENRGRSTRIYPSNPFKSEQQSIKLLEFKSIQNTTRSMPSFPNPNINPLKSTISPVDSHASILTVLIGPRSLLPRGDPASLLVLGRPQQGPGQAGSALHSSFVRGRRVVSGGLPLTCNLRRLREVELRPEGGDLETPGESGKKWQKLKDFRISLDMVETMEYAAYVFMPGNRAFRETQMDLKDWTLRSVCV